MIKRLYKFLSSRYQTLFMEYKVEFKPRYGHGKPAHAELLHIIGTNRAQYEHVVNKALQLKDSIWTIKDSENEKDPVSPAWNNEYLPGLDIIMLYTMLSECKPNKYIEIGSGNSTKVAYKAIKEQKLKTEIISIDPMPRAEIDSLANRIIRKPFEDIDFNILDELNENDILFVDNSHRILPNSDSMVFFLEILPKLKKGVIVHLHDIYLPYDYPQFMCDRFYSEQYGLAMYLLANPKKYQTILPNYFIYSDTDLSKLISPIWEHINLNNVERHGGSYWLKIND
ncbi:MAG: class I SAM-dependent methyltransferase [Bacteroidetes bacterium]|nr:MAG: class I SAM-dependent methyltransferase [Bacteroidota bacterium]REK00985.1 MAG: class I SAM-dependent methyltransferase [Bacteroidota bacterium]REK34588.1 MAG: class I SAM-dependent methyltransferase [Bacteroidota bacterium]REK51847.1 MAG: class I SAM-dependent methyltransferase [Bacteroidota bacterium]